MVTPVSNGLQQQIPAANTFQPGGSTENVRQREERDTKAVANESVTRSSETRSAARAEESRSSSVQASARDEDNGQTSARTTRGSVLDVVV